MTEAGSWIFLGSISWVYLVHGKMQWRLTEMEGKVSAEINVAKTVRLYPWD